MKVNVNSIKTLYRAGKITADGVKDAFDRGWISESECADVLAEGVRMGKLTAGEYEELTGQVYGG